MGLRCENKYRYQEIAIKLHSGCCSEQMLQFAAAVAAVVSAAQADAAASAAQADVVTHWAGRRLAL